MPWIERLLHWLRLGKYRWRAITPAEAEEFSLPSAEEIGRKKWNSP